MHDTAREHGRRFFALYWQPHFRDVVEVGSQDFNGGLRDLAPPGVRYIGLDAEDGPGVDRLARPGEPLPLPDASADVVLTSSAFEHDPCFWETFIDMARVLRPGGLLYLNAPSNHAFHRYPVDCWRFYPDAGPALAAWAARRGQAMALVESFVARPSAQGWSDFVAVFHKPGRPLVRQGRLADGSDSCNGFDIDAEGALLRPQDDTFDMAERDALRESLARSVEACAALRSQLVASTAELDQAYRAIRELKTQLTANPAAGRDTGGIDRG